MQTEASEIANKVRGVAAEKRVTQERIAELLSLSVGSVNARMNGKVAFTSVEILRLARALDADVSSFYPRVEVAA